VFSGNYLVGNEAGDSKSWKDAQKMVGEVQAGNQGEIGGGDPTAGKQGQCDATDQVEARYIIVGSIQCSGFGHLQRCDSLHLPELIIVPLECVVIVCLAKICKLALRLFVLLLTGAPTRCSVHVSLRYMLYI